MFPFCYSPRPLRLRVNPIPSQNHRLPHKAPLPDTVPTLAIGKAQFDPAQRRAIKQPHIHAAFHFAHLLQ